ncbi:MAG: hypothetical protein KBD63_06655 [Bacteriovoracaceae bacterium]|nr:hypothetical protein [Bacteriovoracaceae bacterium]
MKFYFLILSVFYVFSLNLALAAKKTTYTKDEYQPALVEAYNEIGKIHGNQNKSLTRNANATKIEEVQGITTQGTWRVLLSMSCSVLNNWNSTSNNYNKLMTYTAPAVIANDGNKTTYYFQAQKVENIYLEDMEKALEKRKKEFSKEFSDVTVNVARGNDEIYSVTAEYPYSAGVSPSDITKRLKFLMRTSEWTLCDIHTSKEVTNASLWRKLKGDITTLSKPEMVILYPLFAEGYEIASQQGVDGTWTMGYDGYVVWVENFKDHMKIWLRVPKTQSNVTPTQVTQTLEEMKKWEPPKGATLDRVNWDATDIWIGYTYLYKGMTGKDVAKRIDKFKDDEAKDLFKKVKKITRF